MTEMIDLHLHTTFSDGSHPPETIVRMAADAGLRAISICDHDTLDGNDAALAAGKELGVEVLVGVELSVVWNDYRDIHVLGYGFDHHDAPLLAKLKEFRDFRRNRNRMIVDRVNERLAKEGRAPLDVEAVQARAAGAIGRPHIALALVEAGYVRDADDAFRRYLVPCDVPKRFFPLSEAIEMIHAAGGVAVLAHPPFISNDRKELEEMIDAFVSLGLDGVEAYNSGADNDSIDWMLTVARRRKLIVTGGSDFHGESKGDIVIGKGRGNLRIPYACVEEIRAALASRRGGRAN